MTHGHVWWWLLTAACFSWYSVITLYVAVQGTKDVMSMLKALREQGDAEDQNAPKKNPPEPLP